MAEIAHSFQIESDENLQEDQIFSEVSNYIQREFNKVNFTVQGFTATVKSKLLNPVVKLNGSVDIKVKEKKAKVFLNVNAKPNGWFWFEVVVGLFFPVLWVLLGIQWFTQKNKSSELLNHLNNHLDSKFSTF